MSRNTKSQKMFLNYIFNFFIFVNCNVFVYCGYAYIIEEQNSNEDEDEGIKELDYDEIYKQTLINTTFDQYD